MRRFAPIITWMLVLSYAAAAQAEGLNNLKAGVNGLATFPADPVMSAIYPSDELEELPGAVVTAHVVGFGTGIVMCVYRAVSGALDVAFFPFWVFPTMSPEPRWVFWEDTEYD